MNGWVFIVEYEEQAMICITFSASHLSAFCQEDRFKCEISKVVRNELVENDKLKSTTYFEISSR